MVHLGMKLGGLLFFHHSALSYLFSTHRLSRATKPQNHQCLSQGMAVAGGVAIYWVRVDEDLAQPSLKGISYLTCETSAPNAVQRTRLFYLLSNTQAFGHYFHSPSYDFNRMIPA
jgi:hypothetical protein